MTLQVACPWDFLGKNTSPGIFLDQGLSLPLLHWHAGSLSLSHLLDTTAESFYRFLELYTTECPCRGGACPCSSTFGLGEREREPEREGERPIQPYLRDRYLLSVWLDLHSPSTCYQDNTIMVLWHPAFSYL